MGQRGVEVSKNGFFVISREFERQGSEVEPAGVFEREFLDVEINRVGLQRVEYDVRADIFRVDVVQREVCAAAGDVEPVVGQKTVSDNQRSDLQVDRCRGVCIFRSQRVQSELEIRFCRGRLLVKIGSHAEELRRGYGYSASAEEQIVELHGYARRLQHLLVLLVEDADIVDDDSVQKPQIYAPEGHFRAEFPRQCFARLAAHESLHGGDVEQDGQQGVEADGGPQHCIEYVFEFFQLDEDVDDYPWQKYKKYQ